jgi:hypothetical protein
MQNSEMNTFNMVLAQGKTITVCGSVEFWLPILLSRTLEHEIFTKINFKALQH